MDIGYPPGYSSVVEHLTIVMQGFGFDSASIHILVFICVSLYVFIPPNPLLILNDK